jgi:Tol biopolymer transport system component
MLVPALACLVLGPGPFDGWPDSKAVASHPKERHIRNIRKLTFGGQNAEAYWSVDGKSIVWQASQPGFPDEQVFSMRADGSGKKLVSTGLGRCTCSYFSPDGRYIYFSSTHRTWTKAQPQVDMSKGYVWMVNPHYEMYRREIATGKLETVVSLPGYVAETTINPSGKYMVFTSDFQGDLDIYRSDLDGFGVKRLTDKLGYDGGPFVSWDGKKIVYRRGPLDMTEAQQADYRSLLAQHLVRPTAMEIWIMDADGSNKRQVTHLGAANFAPFMLPDGKRIIFASNYKAPTGPDFDLYVINVDGTGLEQVTYTEDFDAFPMVSRDGKKIVWASNRYGSVPGETNVFVADWVD